MCDPPIHPLRSRLTWLFFTDTEMEYQIAFSRPPFTLLSYNKLRFLLLLHPTTSTELSYLRWRKEGGVTFGANVLNWINQSARQWSNEILFFLPSCSTHPPPIWAVCCISRGGWVAIVCEAKNRPHPPATSVVRKEGEPTKLSPCNYLKINGGWMIYPSLAPAPCLLYTYSNNCVRRKGEGGGGLRKRPPCT